MYVHALSFNIHILKDTQNCSKDLQQLFEAQEKARNIQIILFIVLRMSEVIWSHCESNVRRESMGYWRHFNLVESSIIRTNVWRPRQDRVIWEIKRIFLQSAWEALETDYWGKVVSFPSHGVFSSELDVLFGICATPKYCTAYGENKMKDRLAGQFCLTDNGCLPNECYATAKVKWSPLPCYWPCEVLLRWAGW